MKEIKQTERKRDKPSLIKLGRTMFGFACIQPRHTLMVLMFIACVQVVILIVLVGHWSIKRNSYLLPSENRFCITTTTSPYTISKRFNRNTGTIQNSYEQASEVLGMLLIKAVDERYNNEASPAIYNPLMNNKHCTKMNETRSGAVLHEIATYEGPVPGQPAKIFWRRNHTTDSCYNVNEVEREGTISIERSGIYLVSSRLTLVVENGTNSPSYILPGEDFRHYIKLISNQDNTERILLENSMSKCHMLTKKSEKTSHIEAVFKLVKRDRIFVATSHTHKIVNAPLKNSFAIFAL